MALPALYQTLWGGKKQKERWSRSRRSQMFPSDINFKVRGVSVNEDAFIFCSKAILSETVGWRQRQCRLFPQRWASRIPLHFYTRRRATSSVPFLIPTFTSTPLLFLSLDLLNARNICTLKTCSDHLLSNFESIPSGIFIVIMLFLAKKEKKKVKSMSLSRTVSAVW